MMLCSRRSTYGFLAVLAISLPKLTLAYDSGRAAYESAVRKLAESCATCEKFDPGVLYEAVLSLENLYSPYVDSREKHLLITYSYFLLIRTSFEDKPLESMLMISRSKRLISDLLLNEDIGLILSSIEQKIEEVSRNDESMEAYREELYNFVENSLIETAKDLVVSGVEDERALELIEQFWMTSSKSKQEVFKETLLKLLDELPSTEDNLELSRRIAASGNLNFEAP